MAVSFDAVGPSSAGASSATSPLSWTHTAVASGTYVLAGVAVGSGGDGSTTVSATYGGTAMTSLLRWESGGVTENQGFLQVFGLAGVASGAKTVAVTVAPSGFVSITGGSISAAGATTAGTPAHSDSNAANATTGSVTVPSTTSGNLVAAFTTDGSGFTAWTAGTSRFVTNFSSSSAAGNISGATLAAPGGSAVLSWTQSSDWYAAIGVELQAAASALAPCLTPHRIPVQRASVY